MFGPSIFTLGPDVVCQAQSARESLRFMPSFNRVW